MMISISSCSFLEVEKIGKSDIETYFSEVTALEPAMYGIYNLMFGFYDKYFIPYAEVAGDAMTLSVATGEEWVDFYNFATTEQYETTALGYMWKSGYEIINNANQVIYWAPLLKDDFPHDHDLIDNVTASAYFSRALLHFDLCRVYGQNYTYTSDASHLGVAIRDQIPSLSETIARSTVKQVYTQVINDLNEALNIYRNCTYDAFRAGPIAAKALLARVYLYMNNWELAEKYSTDVINDMELTSKDDYIKYFCDPDELGKESIFRLNGYKQTKVLKKFYEYESPVGRPAARLVSMFDSDDVRKQLFSYSYAGKDYTDVMMKFTCTKDVASDEYKYTNLPILRLSEMYLIRAEANVHLKAYSAAETDLKTLISRATGKRADEITLSWSTDAELDKLINIERQKELCFEGHRLFDITRRHENLERGSETTSSVRRMAYPDNRFVLQIPYVEIDANVDMQQNPL